MKANKHKKLNAVVKKMKNRKGWAREETTGARRNSTSVFNFAKEKYMTLSIHMHSIKSLVHFFFIFKGFPSTR